MTLFSHITCDADVWMPHARPFLTSTLQEPSNSIKNTSWWGVLTLAIKFWVLESPGRLPSPHFGSVSVILTLLQSGVATLTHHFSIKILNLYWEGSHHLNCKQPPLLTLSHMDFLIHQLLVLMEQHFTPQLSIMMKQHFAFEFPNHHQHFFVFFLKLL